MDNSDLQKIERGAPVEKIDESAAALELELQRQIDGRKEERFFWIVGMFILGDFFVISHIQSYLLMFPFLLEAGLLIWLAKRLGVDEAVVFLEWVADKIGRSFPSK